MKSTFEEREADYFGYTEDIGPAVKEGDIAAVREILEDTKRRAHEVFNPQCHGDIHIDCYKSHAE